MQQSQEQEILLPNSLDGPDKFCVILTVDKQGAFDVDLDWPGDISPQICATTLAVMLNNLQKGMLRQKIINCLSTLEFEDHDKPVVQMIIQQLHYFQNIDAGHEVLVRPDKLFEGPLT
jgi:hypothetical protein